MEKMHEAPATPIVQERADVNALYGVLSDILDLRSEGIIDIKDPRLRALHGKLLRIVQLERIVSPTSDLDYFIHLGLLQAIKNSDLETVSLLLSRGADATLMTGCGETVFHRAVQSQNEELVSLIASYVPIDIINEDGRTALQLAVEGDNDQIVFILMRCGAQVNIKDSEGNTVLHTAMESDFEQEKNQAKTDMILYLVKHGADLLCKNKDEVSPIDIILIDHIFPDTPTEEKFDYKDFFIKMINCAASFHLSSSLPVVEHFDKDEASYSHLILNFILNDNRFEPQAIFWLADCGVSMNLRFKKAEIYSRSSHYRLSKNDGWTPLFFAISSKSKAKVLAVLLCGADINFKTDEHFIALDVAMHWGSLDIASCLLVFGAELNERLKENWHFGELWARKKVPKNAYDVLEHMDEQLKCCEPYLQGYPLDNLYKGNILFKKCADPLMNKLIRISQTVTVQTLSYDEMIIERFIFAGVPKNIKHFIIWKKFLEVSCKANSARLDVIDLNSIFVGVLLKKGLENSCKRVINERLPKMTKALKEKSIGLTLYPHIHLFSYGRWKTESARPELSENSVIKKNMSVAQRSDIAKSHVVSADCLPCEMQEHFRSGLAIDANGMQLVATASAIKKLEELSGYRAYELFDCMVGSSWGGILALALAASEDGHKPLLKTEKIISFFKERAAELFPTNIKKRSIPYYDIEPVRNALKVLFKDTRLSCALTRVVVPFREKLDTANPGIGFFDSLTAQKSERLDFKLADIACSIIADNVNFAPLSWRENESNFRAVGCAYEFNADELLYESNKDRFDELRNDGPDNFFVILSLAGIEKQESGSQTSSRLKFKELLKGKSRYERINLNVEPADLHGRAVFDAYEKEGKKFFEPKNTENTNTRIKIAKTAPENYELLIAALAGKLKKP